MVAMGRNVEISVWSWAAGVCSVRVLVSSTETWLGSGSIQWDEPVAVPLWTRPILSDEQGWGAITSLV